MTWTSIGTLVAIAIGLAVGFRPSMPRILAAGAFSIAVSGAPTVFSVATESAWTLPLAIIGGFLGAMAVGAWLGDSR